jgi:hypothetical protein
VKRLIAFMAVVFLCAVFGGLALTGGIPPAPTSTACPAGAAVMGCSIGAQDHPTFTPSPSHVGVTPPVAGCLFPDVSSYQGHPDWSATAGSICAAVTKAGEATNIVDPDFAYNVAALRALHIPWAAYWFVRQCTDGPAFAHELAAIGFKDDRDALRPVMDMEVPSAAGCAVPIADSIHKAFGVWPIIYTAPGTWPGGSSGGLNSWEADYTEASAPAAMPFATVVLGWQRYSPPYTDRWLPGLGYVDVSIDLRGFSKQLAFPAPPPTPPPVIHTTTTPTPPLPVPVAPKGTVCWGHDATPSSKVCKAIIARHGWLVNRRVFWGREFQVCIRHADGIGCANTERLYLLRRHQAIQLRARYS